LATTVDNAFSVGRTGNVWQNFIDRLPIRRHFGIRLITYWSRPETERWIERTLAGPLQRPMINAWLQFVNGQAAVERSQDGVSVNTAAALRAAASAMGSLTLRRDPVPIVDVKPGITDTEAAAEAERINTFLAHPPVLHFGKLAVTTEGSVLAADILFPPRPTGAPAALTMDPDISAVQRYVTGLVAAEDIAPSDPEINFDGPTVTEISPGVDGRTFDVNAASARVLRVFETLTPRAVIKVPFTKVRPPVNPSNAASLGVRTLLGEGSSSFAGSPAQRVSDIGSIARQIDLRVIDPGAAISFNYLAGLGPPPGTGWPSRVYQDTERRIDGRVTPGAGGAMQQIATTFFRACYAAGLKLVERHADVYRLPWYQPPAGMDAAVQANGDDLRFQNTTGGYLLVETRVEPVQQAMYVYVYGRKTDWTVDISSPVLRRVYPPAAPINRLDPELSAGGRRYLQYPENGASFLVTRTITTAGKPHRKITDSLVTNYLPRRAIILVGSGNKPSPSPSPTPIPSPSPSPSPTPTATPSPTPTATGRPHLPQPAAHRRSHR